jgi:hypothetical protein
LVRVCGILSWNYRAPANDDEDGYLDNYVTVETIDTVTQSHKSLSNRDQDLAIATDGAIDQSNDTLTKRSSQKQALSKRKSKKRARDDCYVLDASPEKRPRSIKKVKTERSVWDIDVSEDEDITPPRSRSSRTRQNKKIEVFEDELFPSSSAPEPRSDHPIDTEALAKKHSGSTATADDIRTKTREELDAELPSTLQMSTSVEPGTIPDGSDVIRTVVEAIDAAELDQMTAGLSTFDEPDYMRETISPFKSADTLTGKLEVEGLDDLDGPLISSSLIGRTSRKRKLDSSTQLRLSSQIELSTPRQNRHQIQGRNDEDETQQDELQIEIPIQDVKIPISESVELSLPKKSRKDKDKRTKRTRSKSEPKDIAKLSTSPTTTSEEVKVELAVSVKREASSTPTEKTTVSTETTSAMQILDEKSVNAAISPVTENANERASEKKNKSIHSPLRATAAVPYRVGLSKRAHIAPLLRIKAAKK